MKKFLILLFSLLLSINAYGETKIDYHVNGQTKSTANYKDGELDGKWTAWHDNGQKYEEGNYKPDKISGGSYRAGGHDDKDGKWNWWYRDGQLWGYANYIDGNVVGKSTWWFQNGQKEFEENWKYGKLDGKTTYWYITGNKKNEKNYKDGKLDGKSTFWKSGKVSSEVWEDDVLLTKSWNCESGYYQANQNCALLPSNTIASTDGNGYYCKPGYIKRGLSCLQKSEDEMKKPEKVVDDDKVYSAASGSGFAVTSDGYVITNYHVIKGCTDVYIHDKGESILSTIVTFDPNNDIALLKGNFKPKSFYPLSRESTKLLTDVYVAGHPFGRDISTAVKVTRGIVSSLTGVANNFSNLQIDASLQPGNSGGPIMNNKGNVIGVAVSKLNLDKIVEDYGVVPENVNFGVKSNVVINIMESENIKLPKPNLNSLAMSDLSEMITDGTYYLSCWMTMAQIETMLEQKVMFSNLK